ncbi:MAG: TolC family protein [Chitinophagaceae bacterium]|nr:TolC family protein [Chitinophagaceae bacterium]
MKRTLFLFCYFLLGGLPVPAQQATAMPATLQRYVRQALDSNLVLRQRHLSLQQSVLALQEARSYFLPAVEGLAGYQTAGGGRSINIPVGDLLNPVYATLNQLTGSGKFPTISNVEEQFFPKNFYDVKLRTTYPIYNPSVRYGAQIAEQKVRLSEKEVDLYKRELIRDVKSAYYSYLMATEAVRIYEATRVVVQRSLQVNQSLYNNGKGLPAYISRSEADLLQVEAQIESSRNDAAKAKAYFNFLLNRGLAEEVETTDLVLPTLGSWIADEAATKDREELAQLRIAQQINETLLRLQESNRMPRISTFLDLGAQAQQMKVDRQAPYYLLGVQLEVPIFQGRRNQYKIAQARQQVSQVQLQQAVVAKQLELAAFSARNNVLTAVTNHRAANKQAEAAQSYFKLIDRGRAEGSNSYIEWLDARNQLTLSQIQQQLSKYRALTALAEYERQAATATLSDSQ